MDFILQHISYVFIVGGLIGLFLGGDALIKGAVAVAEGLKVPKLVVGLTIVGFGTSMPELLVALQSVAKGAPDIAVGNVVGSNIANILLILGFGALIYPVATTAQGLKRDMVVVLLASAALCYLAWTGLVPRWAGIAMFAALLVYLLVVYLLSPKQEPEDLQDTPRLSAGWAVIYICFGLLLLIGGAHFLVDGATTVARQFGVSEAVIGLTLVAVGTSLPELTVTIISAMRRHSEVALGNVVGSNIFNILAILGITAMVTPLPVSADFLQVDLPLLMGSALVLAVLILRGKPIGRVWGLIFLLGYAAYTTWLLLGTDGITALVSGLIAPG